MNASNTLPTSLLPPLFHLPSLSLLAPARCLPSHFSRPRLLPFALATLPLSLLLLPSSAAQSPPLPASHSLALVIVNAVSYIISMHRACDNHRRVLLHPLLSVLFSTNLSVVTARQFSWLSLSPPPSRLAFVSSRVSHACESSVLSVLWLLISCLLQSRCTASHSRRPTVPARLCPVRQSGRFTWLQTVTVCVLDACLSPSSSSSSSFHPPCRSLPRPSSWTRAMWAADR